MAVSVVIDFEGETLDQYDEAVSSTVLPSCVKHGAASCHELGTPHPAPIDVDECTTPMRVRP